MEPATLGLVLDSSVLVAAERANQNAAQVLEYVRSKVGDVPIVICALTVAELAHGIHRANTAERAQQRRRFVDDLKAAVPIYPVTETTAEIVGRIGAELAAKGAVVPLADLIIGACALELGYAIATQNTRDFNRVPDLKVVVV